VGPFLFYLRHFILQFTNLIGLSQPFDGPVFSVFFANSNPWSVLFPD
jgi:hypothetical protein